MNIFILVFCYYSCGVFVVAVFSFLFAVAVVSYWHAKRTCIHIESIKNTMVTDDLTPCLPKAPFQYKDLLLHVWDSHVKDKTVATLLSLSWGSLYW